MVSLCGRVFSVITRAMPVLLVLAVLVLPVQVVEAHGGGVPRLTNAVAGPYWVSVWTQPDPLRVGQAHITVAVSQPASSAAGREEAGPPVLGADVWVQFRPLDHAGDALQVRATHEGAANKLFYEADLDLPEVGRWEVLVSVKGDAGSGDAGFEAEVSAPRSTNWWWIGGLGLGALTVLWVFQKRQRQPD
jgi:hypothetical protein